MLKNIDQLLHRIFKQCRKHRAEYGCSENNLKFGDGRKIKSLQKAKIPTILGTNLFC